MGKLMPDIWDNQLFITSKGEILGVLASWAVRQSPYQLPENLEKALTEFWLSFEPCPAFNLIGDDYFETNCKDLRSRIRETMEKCPSVLGWNVAKKGSGSSRFDQPKADIDLDALARNVAHTITLDAKYRQAHDCSNTD